MEDRSELRGALVRVLQILHDYADALVLVGGWVPDGPTTKLTGSGAGGVPPVLAEALAVVLS